MASRLFRHLKPKRGKIDKFTIFIIWLLLCLERPWERLEFMNMSMLDFTEDGLAKAWRFNLTEKSGENIWNRIDKLLDDILEDYFINLQLRTLRQQLKKSRLKSMIFSLLIEPNLYRSLGESFSEFEKSLAPLTEAMSKLGRSDLFHAASIMEYLKEQKYINKRDLMRKFRINKTRCDCLLEYILSEDESYLNIIDGLANNSVWIVYTGP